MFDTSDHSNNVLSDFKIQSSCSFRQTYIKINTFKKRFTLTKPFKMTTATVNKIVCYKTN